MLVLEPISTRVVPTRRLTPTKARTGLSRPSNRSLFAAPIPAGKRSGEVRDWGRISGCTGRFWATEDRAILLLRRQIRGKSKTIPTAAGNRICAGLRGGAGRTQTDNHVIMSPS
jgi:hypothetical protein